MMAARCCGAASVRSAIMAWLPVMEEAEPAPMSSRAHSTAGSPLCIRRPVAQEPVAVTSVP